MDTIAEKGIIPRVPGPGGTMITDVKWVFSSLWQNKKEVIDVIERVKKGPLSPEEALELLFAGGSTDSLLRCFLILASLNNQDVLELVNDLRVIPKRDCVYGGVDEAVDWFFTIYTKERICCGRHDQGRKKPRTTA